MRIFRNLTPASEGYALGPVYIYAPGSPPPAAHLIRPGGVEEELARYRRALAAARAEIGLFAANSEIFAAQLDIAGDPVLEDAVEGRIREKLQNAELALAGAGEELAALFAAVKDEYLREREADIRDVCARIYACLTGTRRAGLSAIVQPAVVVARDLSPSDTVGINPACVLGFITEEGGVTGHVAIIARSLELPAIVGARGLLKAAARHSAAALDAVAGSVIFDPGEAERGEHAAKAEKLAARRARLRAMNALPAETQDGCRVLLCVNAGSPQAIEKARAYGIDGVGLLRSEFLYMEKARFPSEDEQYAAYRRAAELSPGELIIRTLDIGGDKALPYYPIPPEENPFLGRRGIRLCLSEESVFKTQLRAVLRASVHGGVKLMFPMIASLDELLCAKALLARCARELAAEGLPHNAALPVGIMIETPAAVLCAGQLAPHCDFFSIGTNDLTQYLLAVDRNNPKVAALYNSFSPAVLRAVADVAEAARGQGIPVGICGELAGEARAVPLLLGLGLNELSVSASLLPAVRRLIRALCMEDARALAAEALTLSRAADIEALAARFLAGLPALL